MTEITNHTINDLIQPIALKLGYDTESISALIASMFENPNSTVFQSLQTYVECVAKKREGAAAARQTRVVTQALSDDEQCKLQRSFPEYVLVFNPQSHAGHALAAAFRSMETSILTEGLRNCDCIVDVGGNPLSHLFTGRSNVHCCCPVIDSRDSARKVLADEEIRRRYKQLLAAERGDFSARTMMKPGIKQDELRERIRVYNENKAKFVCEKKSQFCDVKADRMLMVHSSYDVKISEIFSMLEIHDCSRLDGVMLFDPNMLINDAGNLPFVNGVYDIDRASDTIRMSFRGDPSYVYKHNYTNYIAYTRNHVTEREGKTFVYEVLQLRGNSLFFRATMMEGCGYGLDIDPNAFQISATKEYVVVNSFEFDGSGSRFSESSLTPRRIVVPYLLFENLLSAATALTDVRCTRANVFAYARSLNIALVLNGVTIMSPEILSSEELGHLATSIFVMVVTSKWHARRVTATMLDAEHRHREATESWFVGNVLSIIRDSTVGVALSWYNDMRNYLLRLYDDTTLTVGFSYTHFFVPLESLVTTDLVAGCEADLGRLALCNSVECDPDVPDPEIDVALDNDVRALMEAVSPSLSTELSGEFSETSSTSDDTVATSIDLDCTTKIKETIQEYIGYCESTVELVVADAKELIRRIKEAGIMCPATVKMLNVHGKGANVLVPRVQYGGDSHQPMVATTATHMAAIRIDTLELVYSTRDASGTKFDKSCGPLFVNDDFEVFNWTSLADAARSALLKNTFQDIKFTLVEGLPGAGKTRWCFDNIDQETLYVCASRKTADSFRKRTRRRIPIVYEKMVRTSHSYIMKPNITARRVFFDEGLMVHAAELWLCAILAGAEEVVVLGDRMQIQFINRIEKSFRTPLQDYVKYSHVTELNVSHRVPQDVAYVLNKFYGGRFKTTSRVKNSLKFKSIFSLEELVYSPTVQYIVYHQWEKQIMVSKGFLNTVSAHESEGEEYPHVAVVRLDATTGGIYDSQPHTIVVLSRATNSTDYYSMGKLRFDLPRRLINEAKNLTETCLETVRGSFK